MFLFFLRISEAAISDFLFPHCETWRIKPGGFLRLNFVTAKVPEVFAMFRKGQIGYSNFISAKFFDLFIVVFFHPKPRSTELTLKSKGAVAVSIAIDYQ